MLKSNGRERPAKLAPATTHLQSASTTEEVLHNLDILKLKDYQRFVKVTDVGGKITRAVNEDDKDTLEKLLDENMLLLPFLKLYLDDGFVQAVHLRYEELVEYFLRNGYDAQNNCEEAVHSLCNSLQYLRSDPPVDLLRMLLKYGASTSYCEEEESQTALHIAAKYGCLPFVKLLVEFGGDYDAVDNHRKTPLNYAEEGKHAAVGEYLRSLGAKFDWKY